MINDNPGTIHYINAAKKGQKVGVKIGLKVIHFTTTNDEHFEIGDEVVVSMARKPAEAMIDVIGERGDDVSA